MFPLQWWEERNLCERHITGAFIKFHVDFCQLFKPVLWFDDSLQGHRSSTIKYDSVVEYNLLSKLFGRSIECGGCPVLFA